MSIQNGFDSHLKHAEGDFGRGGDFQLGFRQFLVGGAHFELVFHEPDTRTHARTRLSRGENQHQNHRPTCKHTIKIATKKKCCPRESGQTFSIFLGRSILVRCVFFCISSQHLSACSWRFSCIRAQQQQHQWLKKSRTFQEKGKKALQENERSTVKEHYFISTNLKNAKKRKMHGRRKAQYNPIHVCFT